MVDIWLVCRGALHKAENSKGRNQKVAKISKNNRRVVHWRHQVLSFNLYVDIDSARDITATVDDVIVEGAGGRLTVGAPIFAQGNPMPTGVVHEFRFRLSEQRQNQWSPELSERDFRRLLQNVTAVKIRASYGTHGKTLTRSRTGNYVVVVCCYLSFHLNNLK